MTDITNTSDTIDVRDVIARFEELEGEIESYAEKMEDWQANSENVEEHALLAKLLDELKGNGGDEQWRGDWYPVTLIRRSYFNQVMDELVEECYELPKDLPSFMIITLDYVALEQDYTSVDYDGVEYLYR